VVCEFSHTISTVILIILISDQREESVLVPHYAGMARHTRYDWNYTTEAIASMNGRRIAISAGKVIGGSSVLNDMVFNRGAASDYDAWGDLGNAGWTFEALFPYFLKV
jgi:choline dehydrogenase-like flavoprotein